MDVNKALTSKDTNLWVDGMIKSFIFCFKSKEFLSFIPELLVEGISNFDRKPAILYEGDPQKETMGRMGLPGL